MKKLLSLLLALMMVFALSSTALADVIPAASARAVAVDGEISAEEWGAPSFHGDKNTNWGYNAAYDWDFWAQGTQSENESYDVWLDHDDSYAYVAVRLNNTRDAVQYATGPDDLWKNVSLAFTLSAYDASTTVPRITFEGAEYRTVFLLGHGPYRERYEKGKFCAGTGPDAAGAGRQRIRHCL